MADPNHLFPNVGFHADDNQRMAAMASLPRRDDSNATPPSQHQQLSHQPPLDHEAATEADPGSHKRTYQACIACRQRKVKCDRGPVDTPIDGPCRRCKREKKECLFSATRKKRKRADDPNASPDDDLDDDFVRRNGRSRHAHGTLDPFQGGPYEVYAPAPAHDGRGAANGQSVPTTRPSRLDLATYHTEPRNLTNEAAATLLVSPINNPGEALHLLVDAAKRSEDMERRQGSGVGRHAPNHDNRGTTDGSHVESSPIDPAITADSREEQSDAQRAVVQAALQAWSRLRFVHAGWITNKEAMQYIEYYYQFLAPLTPITIPDFSSPASHPKLLSEEPVLVMTVLTIASRFMKLEGAAGKSRSFLVHDKLWTYLQGMITRMFWGQEQFGGGFCGAGSPAMPGLRGLGTVESLLLLSDWYPRSMHFPPGDDGNELLLPLPHEENGIRTPLSQHNSVGWAEPAIRSDRMSWSLIGCAYTLAFELGVFDCIATQTMWEPRNEPGFERSNRVARLLYIYVGLITGKLGYPDTLPQQVRAAHGSAYLKMVMPEEISMAQYPDGIQDNVQRAWAEITSLMRATNDEMFPTRARTEEIVRSRSYFGMLQKYQPRLEEWLKRFHKLQVPPQARTLLLMEYEYMRSFCNSHALQAVLDACASDTSTTNNGRSVSPMPPNPGSTPPALLSSRLVDIMKINAPYIKEVTDASRNLLRHALSGLSGPSKMLKYAPVRTYYRIFSCAMFLLKSFALGGKSNEVEISLRLLKDTIHALRQHVVDDVHLCNRIADLLESLTRTIASKFVILAVPGSSGSGQSTMGQARQSHDIVNSNANVSSTNRSQLHHGPGSGQARTSLAAPHRPTSSRYHPSRNSFADDLYSGPLAGIAVNSIDPHDARFTIMPPPDFVYPPHPGADGSSTNNPQNGGQREDVDMTNYAYPPPSQEPVNNSLYAQLQVAANDAHYGCAGDFHAQRGSPETSFSSPPSHTASNNNNNNNNAHVNGGGAGAGAGAGAAGYSWMALDLQNYGNPQPQNALQTRANSAYGGALNSAGSFGGEGQEGNGGWGAFGPEISGSLETLGLLGEGFPGMGMGVGLGMGMGNLDGGVWEER